MEFLSAGAVLCFVCSMTSDGCVPNMWQLCSKNANFGYGMHDARKIGYFFLRANILINIIIINH